MARVVHQLTGGSPAAVTAPARGDPPRSGVSPRGSGSGSPSRTSGGTLVLHEIFSPDSVDFFVLFSSISAAAP
ncbi:KR domain-containing protein [Streptomyces noursei]|nr:KR domain-containing protein [Streptomyces noursei]